MSNNDVEKTLASLLEQEIEWHSNHMPSATWVPFGIKQHAGDYEFKQGFIAGLRHARNHMLPMAAGRPRTAKKGER